MKPLQEALVLVLLIKPAVKYILHSMKHLNIRTTLDTVYHEALNKMI